MSQPANKAIPDRRRRTETLQSNQSAAPDLERERLPELLAQTPAAIGLLSGPELRWKYVNDEYVRLTGRNSAAEFIGKTVVESLPELQPNTFVGLLEEVYRTGRPYFGREAKATLNRSAKGLPPESYWDFAYQPIRDAQGRVEGILVHGLEVTDRVLARKKIEESDQRLRLAQQASGIGTFELDLQTGGNRWTAELEAMYGLAPGTFEGTNQHWERLIHPDDRSAVLKEQEIAFETGMPVQAEWRVLWPDGSIHWILARWQVFKDESGTPVRIAGINIDVTERKAAEEARRRLAAIVESSDDAIISKDLNGIVTSWNRQAERLFGYTETEMVGRSILTIIPPELQMDEDMILSRIRSGQKIDHFETVRLAKSGERIEVSLSISPVRDEHGHIVGAAKIARDIRESKKIERSLRTAEKLAAAGRLAATVAHEINNPLEAVTNLVYLAKRALPPDAGKLGEYLNLAGRELDRVAHITRQTLGFYRDTSSPVRFNVAQVLDELLSLYQRRLESRNIRVIREYDQSAELLTLAGEVRQAFSNLISNSMDAMPAGGTLRIRIQRTHDWRNAHIAGVRITVADSGTGIRPEHKSNLFQPFFTTKEDIGTGLGLWITRSIVEKKGGVIQVKSKTGPNHGTTFSIFLPIQEKEGSGDVEKEIASVAHQGTAGIPTK